MNAATPHIQCGNHPLLPEVTITEIYSHTYIDGRSVQLAEQPEITITCITCGKTSPAENTVFEIKRA